MAVRDNEDAARALGVDAVPGQDGRDHAVRPLLGGLAGVFYAQYFLYLDPYIAYGPAISVESLLVPIIGGMGTLFGPLLGSAALHACLGTDPRADRRRSGHQPGALRRAACCHGAVPAARPAGSCSRWLGAGDEYPPSGEAAPCLRSRHLQIVRRRAASNNVSAHGSGRQDHLADRPERRRQDDAVRADHRLPEAGRG
jgi:hypothetical protein